VTNLHASRLGWLRRGALPAVITIAIVVALAHVVDVHQLAAAPKSADWRAIVAATLLASTVCMLGGIARLWILLRRLPHDAPIRFAELTSIQFASSAAHNVLPAPAGDVVRTVQLAAHGYRVSSLIAAQLVDKTIEAIGLGIGAAVMATLGRLPAPVASSMYVVALGGAAGLVAVVVAARSHRPEPHDDAAPATWRARAAQLWHTFCAAAHRLGAPSLWVRGLAWSLLGDAANAATIALCAIAVDISLPWPAWFAALVAARVVGVLPSTPGQLGVQEAGVVVALGLFGVDGSRALAAALLHHAVHLVPITLIGGVETWRRRSRSRRR
jgi:uncharacterized membrane protein YbhN (UPF0104 family)